MTHTKKRILAMLLAVVLMFSALPFSVSADELPGELSTESTVESQPEESQAEEPEEQAPAENAITISDSSGDVPVLRAQDPFTQVKNDVEGGTNYMCFSPLTPSVWRENRWWYLKPCTLTRKKWPLILTSRTRGKL